VERRTSSPIGSDSDPNAVLDQRCKVLVTENLYLVDASVFPIIPSVVPNPTVMMLGKRIADWMKAKKTQRQGFCTNPNAPHTY
jgi:choline dehydrogenase-like flavoprotein